MSQDDISNADVEMITRRHARFQQRGCSAGPPNPYNWTEADKEDLKTVLDEAFKK